MSTNREDPYFIVRDEVQKSVQHLQQLHQAWSALDRSRRAGGAYNVEQLKWHTDEIRSTIKTIEWDIQDLEETVRIVEANPQKFRLDGPEVQRRKAFVDQSKSSIDTIRKALAGAASGAPTSPTKAAGPAGSSSSTGAASSSSNANRNELLRGAAATNNAAAARNPNADRTADALIRSEQQQQQYIMQDQDQQLDKVYQTVVNMKNIAGTMNAELDDQARMLDNLDHKTDGAQNKLQAATGRLNTIFKASKADCKTTMCIAVLSIIVIILLVLAITT